jgi:peptidyl-prolyl cis-trans isomerase D
MIKLQREEQKYITLLSKAISANKLDAKDAYNAQAENSDIVYAMQPYTSIPDSVIPVSKSEIEKLYNQRKEAYKQPESKVIKYIVVNIVPSQDDYNKVSTEMEQAKDELATLSGSIKDFVADNSETPYVDAFRSETALESEVKQFVGSAAVGEMYGPFLEQSSNKYRLFKLMEKTIGPDSVNVSHIMIANDGRETVVGDSLLNVLKRGGNFTEVAAAHSIDQNSSTNGGELGWLTEEAALSVVNEEFKAAIFSANLNEVFIFKSPQGSHLLKVTAKTANVPKYKVAEINKTVSPSSKTYSDLYNSLNQFIAKNRDLNKMDTAAQNAGYTLFSDVSLTASDETVGNIPQSRRVVRWAFEHSRGDISEIFDCENKYFIVAGMQGTVKKGYRSLTSLEPSLKAELVARKKGEKIAEELKAKNLASVDAYAQTMNTSADSVRFINFSTPRISGIGMEPKLNAMISLAPLNTVSAPVAGNNGVYVFEVFSKTNNGLPYDERTQTDAINSSSTYKYGYQSMQLLINRANIQDNRLRFY